MPRTEKSRASEMLQSKPALRDKRENSLYEHLLNRLRKVQIDGETYYVAEGDTLLDVDQLFVYAQQREAFEKKKQADRIATDAGLGFARLVGITTTGERGLLGMVQGGKIVRWEPGLKLSYCVLKSTFSNNEQYVRVGAAMAEATKAWEDACGVSFEY